ncbi:histidine kinase [Rhodoferax sp.]|uniref:sensor histidine kinase n=1 Tax=Rhodoferax sp. TaxID=50421 RepID=UPI002608180A|nr:histidine kinase [Rhodoferax sp.]MDD2926483.1 histidine kinase [Rhodoferax sp.]
MTAPTDLQEAACGPMQAALRLNLLYWLCMYAMDGILGYFVGIDPFPSTPTKIVLFGMSALITYLMAALLFRLRDRFSFLQKALLCFLMAAIAAPLFASVDFIQQGIFQYPGPVYPNPASAGYTLIEGVSMLFGWSCLFVAVLDNFEVQERERLLAEVRKEALMAQMQALRYQINPHFLFNTLNSIAGLIEEGAAVRAERMVHSLSSFMRTTLTLDPMNDVTLAEEIALQQEYLNIEHERFSDRMCFSCDVSDSDRSALVPSLILQPLVENAIKHGLGSTSGPVEISLSARREMDRLHITVENDMAQGGTPVKRMPSAGVGLNNVSQRLNVRFTGDARFTHGPVSPGRYRAAIDLPWRSA